MTKRYVALGSSMAAGPGIAPRDKDAPLRAFRSANNYPHLVARRLGLDLVDVTYSGATTAHVLTDRQNGAPPQIRALVAVGESLKEVGRTIRRCAPRARVLFVDYLTVLPPADQDASPLSGADAALGRRIAATLERLTAEAADATGAELVRSSDASREHHAWSPRPWTTKPSRIFLPVPGRPFPAHPNAAGMRAVADLIIGVVGS